MGPRSNKVDVTLSPGGAIKIFNQNGNVSLLGDIVGYYTTTSLAELAARLAAVEAQASANTAGIAALDAAQPFIEVSDTINSVDVTGAPTEIRSVEVTAPVDGHVASMATGYMEEFTDGQFLQCGVMDSIASPLSGEELLWQSPTGGDAAHLAASRVFDIAARRNRHLLPRPPKPQRRRKRHLVPSVDRHLHTQPLTQIERAALSKRVY